MSLKAKIIYWVAAAAFLFLLWLGNEGDNPIVYKGSALQFSGGSVNADGSLNVSETSCGSGIVCSTPQLLINKGTYTASIDCFSGDGDNVVELWDQGLKVAGWNLRSGEASLDFDFTLPKDMTQFQVRVNYCGRGELIVKKITITPAGQFYSDTYYLMLVFLALLAFVYLRLNNLKRKPVGREHLTDLFIVTGLALLAHSPMFTTYLYNADDLCYHLARIEGVKDAILDGQIPAIIMPEAMKGNGYLNAMYPYLFVYIAAILRICRVSVALSYKTLIFLANFSASAFSYMAARSLTKNRKSYILITVLFTLMPYRFTNIYSRGDLGEILAISFIPFLIAGLYHVIFGDRAKWPMLLVAMSGILQSHILSFMFAVGICFIAALVFVRRIITDKRWIEIGKAAGMTVLVNLWFLVPFIYYYSDSRISIDVLRWSGYFEQSITLANMTMTYSPYNNQFFSLGLPLLGCIGVIVIYLFCDRLPFVKEDEAKTESSVEDSLQNTNLDRYLVFLFVIGIVMTWFVTGYFPNRDIMEHVPLFKNWMEMIQFPWRFLGPASACFAFAGAIWLCKSLILKNYRSFIFALLIGLNLLTVILVAADNNHMPYGSKEDLATKGHETKLAASVGIFYPYEYRLNCVGDDKLTTSIVVSDLNSVAIDSFEKEGTHTRTQYISYGKDNYIELPVLEYKGYRAYDENGDRLEITEGEQGRIRIYLKDDSLPHSVITRFGPVPGFVIANVISALSLVLPFVFSYLRRKKTGD